MMGTTNEELLAICNTPAQSQEWADYVNAACMELADRGLDLEQSGENEYGPVYGLKERDND